MTVLCKNCGKKIILSRDYTACPYCAVKFELDANDLIGKEKAAIRYRWDCFINLFFSSFAIVLGISIFLLLFSGLKFTSNILIAELILVNLWTVVLVKGQGIISRLPDAQSPKAPQ
jgi:predicted amidophosphoribosyltransferase